jgi:lysyl-tRNA synthetase class 2
MISGADNFTSFPPLGNLRRRDEMISSLRGWFHANCFHEVETPVRIPAPAPEPNIDCPPSAGAWLRASPELQMKRLLAAGADRIFQIGPCFRERERGARHNPEFTMLEWYRRGASAGDILLDTMALVRQAVRDVLGGGTLVYRGRSIDIGGDWTWLTVRDAFRRFAGWDPAVEWDADRFDVDLTTKVEPLLPADRPVVLGEYPAPAASLARLKPGDPLVAERWELYIGGMEIANAYGELADGAEQRRRFEAAREERAKLGEADYGGLDEGFLGDLESGAFPQCGGIAVGIDRLAMLFCDATSIDEVRPFCPKIGLCW